MRRLLGAAFKMLVGVSLGLVIAEFAFDKRDDGAFPHVNFYEPDDVLATRLKPHATERISFSGNPVTTAHTNALGFRGADWPATAPGEVLVVGDSQVFGLGVEDGETFSAQLGQKLTVLNAGVPTYGPGEYTALVERFLTERKVSTVIYVMNLSNDLFEVDRPNTTRHAVWDGWAVRKETAPKSVTAFPFRSWVMSQSHLMFAARKALAGPIAAEAAPSEGTWKDLVAASAHVVIPPDADEETKRLLEAREAASEKLDALDNELQGHFESQLYLNERFHAAAKVLTPGEDPRDILSRGNGEEAQPIHYVAAKLLQASLSLTKTEAALEAIAKKSGDTKLEQLLSTRRTLREQLSATAPKNDSAPTDPLSKLLARTQAACAAHGAKLFVVALPLDVMVSADEWKKYGGTPIDMSASKVLIDDLLKKAELVGARAFDLTPALTAAEPGAFLNGDLHLTAKGHRAVAEALREELNKPDKPKSTLELPPGRSWPPTDDEWAQQTECNVKGSTAAQCETKLLREWLRVDCRTNTAEPYVETYGRVVVDQGGHGDVMHVNGAALVPFLEGDSTKLTFGNDEAIQTLSLEWPKGGARVMAFGPRQLKKGFGRDTWNKKAMEHYNHVSDPLRSVDCPAGTVATGATRQCHALCNADGGCDQGHCEPWPSGAFCAMP